MALLRSGVQVLLVGGGSAATGYLIGVLVPKLVLPAAESRSDRIV